LGTKRSGSESNQNSPKKRKILAVQAPSTKAKNRNAQSRAAQERAEDEAAKHSQQIASREDRAMKRSAVSVSKRSRATALRQTKLPSVKSTRLTTVSFQRKSTKPGALKPVGKSSRVQAAIGRTVATGTTKRKGIPPTKRPSTPTSSSGAAESDSDHDSPNITPAALRSASRKMLSHPQSDSKPAAKIASRFDMDQDQMSPVTAAGTSRLNRKNPVSAPRGMHATGAGVKKTHHPAQSRSRSTRGR
jgi:palmitoyltransferase ZDHHC9/14/18